MHLRKKQWSVDEITRQIHNIEREASSPYNDGYTGWYIKQDLYVLKDILDSAIKNTPSYGETEKEWLQEREKSRIIKHLKS
jgi:hypothetical protein